MLSSLCLYTVAPPAGFSCLVVLLQQRIDVAWKTVSRNVDAHSSVCPEVKDSPLASEAQSSLSQPKERHFGKKCTKIAKRGTGPSTERRHGVGSRTSGTRFLTPAGRAFPSPRLD